MAGTAFDGNEEPSVELMTDEMPAKKTSSFFFLGQLLGCSGDDGGREMISLLAVRSETTVVRFLECVLRVRENRDEERE